MAQFGETVWFRTIGEDGVSSFASRMTRGILAGHHDRTGAVLCITTNGVVRGKSWTRQTLSDAWESINWEGLCGTPWQMVAPVLKLMKKVTADKEGAGPPLPRIVVERAPEAEPRGFYVLSADIEAHGQTGGCPGCAALVSHGKATKPHNDEWRKRIRTIIERILTGKARILPSGVGDRIDPRDASHEEPLFLNVLRAVLESVLAMLILDDGIMAHSLHDINFSSILIRSMREFHLEDVECPRHQIPTRANDRSSRRRCSFRSPSQAPPTHHCGSLWQQRSPRQCVGGLRCNITSSGPVSDVSTSRGRSWQRDLPSLISPQTHLQVRARALRCAGCPRSPHRRAKLAVSKQAAVSRPNFWSRAPRVVRVPS